MLAMIVILNYETNVLANNQNTINLIISKHQNNILKNISKVQRLPQRNDKFLKCCPVSRTRTLEMMSRTRVLVTLCLAHCPRYKPPQKIVI